MKYEVIQKILRIFAQNIFDQPCDQPCDQPYDQPMELWGTNYEKCFQATFRQNSKDLHEKSGRGHLFTLDSDLNIFFKLTSSKTFSLEMFNISSRGSRQNMTKKVKIMSEF